MEESCEGGEFSEEEEGGHEGGEYEGDGVVYFFVTVVVVEVAFCDSFEFIDQFIELAGAGVVFQSSFLYNFMKVSG